MLYRELAKIGPLGTNPVKLIRANLKLVDGISELSCTWVQVPPLPLIRKNNPLDSGLFFINFKVCGLINPLVARISFQFSVNRSKSLFAGK